MSELYCIYDNNKYLAEVCNNIVEITSKYYVEGFEKYVDVIGRVHDDIFVKKVSIDDGFNITKDIISEYDTINIIENTSSISYYNLKRKVIKLSSSTYYGNDLAHISIALLSAGISIVDKQKNKYISILNKITNNLKLLYILPIATIIINFMTYTKEDTIKEIISKKAELEKATEEKPEENNINGGNSNSYGGGSGSLEKCNYINRALTNEEAGKKVAGLMGASVGTGKYCDKLAPESVAALSPDGTCVYKVTFAHRTQSCVYYIGVETGNIIGNPSCTSKLVEEGEAQCIVMDSMGITKREQSGIIKNIDGGSEWIYEVEDMYGTPDEEGKQYVYEYHVSKYTGQITSKTAIRELQ